MNLLRLLKVLLRGLRPISASLHLIATDLHTLTRIQTLRLRLEHNEILHDEQKVAGAGKPEKEDLTELSWSVKEPEIDPETGQPVVEDEDEKWTLDLGSIFGKGK